MSVPLFPSPLILCTNSNVSVTYHLSPTPVIRKTEVSGVRDRKLFVRKESSARVRRISEVGI